MPVKPIQISRYPNRRFYNRDTSKYVSLQEIEALIHTGKKVEIRDSQSGDDLTRLILTRMIMERQPEKMLLFPTDMLHCILRSNDAMTEFLRDYFQHSLTYLNYLQRHGTSVNPLSSPMHWVKALLDGISPSTTETTTAPPVLSDAVLSDSSQSDSSQSDSPQTESSEQADLLAQKIAQLEERLRQLETREQVANAPATDDCPPDDENK
jgi:polyhydroxyalkanoate synthesis repressor PhaR